MECKKCGGIWKNRIPNPKQCPICHRYHPEIQRKWTPINNNPSQSITTLEDKPVQEVNTETKENETW